MDLRNPIKMTEKKKRLIILDIMIFQRFNNPVDQLRVYFVKKDENYVFSFNLLTTLFSQVIIPRTDKSGVMPLYQYNQKN